MIFDLVNFYRKMPFVIQDKVSVPLTLGKKLPKVLLFQPFVASLRVSDPYFPSDLSKNPLFVEAVVRIRLFHELSLHPDGCVDQQEKLAALAQCAPQNSTSKLLLDIMSLWGKKMLKVKSLSEIMLRCTHEMGSKLIISPSKSSNPRCAETPYTLEQKMASLEDTMKRKLGSELLSIQVQIAEKRRRMNFSCEAVETLKRWFSAHSLKPYPTEQEKDELAKEAGITVNQVTNWFINMRKRNWDPAA